MTVETISRGACAQAGALTWGKLQGRASSAQSDKDLKLSSARSKKTFAVCAVRPQISTTPRVGLILLRGGTCCSLRLPCNPDSHYGSPASYPSRCCGRPAGKSPAFSSNISQQPPISATTAPELQTCCRSLRRLSLLCFHSCAPYNSSFERCCAARANSKQYPNTTTPPANGSSSPLNDATSPPFYPSP